MVKTKESILILDRLREKIKSKSFLESSRVNRKDFTRTRKMPFQSLVCFMLNSIKQTIQKEVTHFIQRFTQSDNMTKSAYCQHRIKLKPEAFIDLNNTIIEEFYTDNTIKTWNEFRLLSIDGSALELPNSKEIADYFGVNSDKNQVPMAKISTMYDLLNNMILDSDIAKSHESEYNQAIHHLTMLKKDDILILDRGYAARWLFYILTCKKVDYVVRLQHESGNDINQFWNS
ncbi:MAG: transposase, partial [Deltaproteobacteria bacterium]